jgi:hypothetical protein
VQTEANWSLTYCHLSPGLQIWAVCHKCWTYSCHIARQTHQATQQPIPVSHTLSCTLPWLPTRLWVPSAHRRPRWTGNMRAGSSLPLNTVMLLQPKSLALALALVLTLSCLAVWRLPPTVSADLLPHYAYVSNIMSFLFMILWICATALFLV